jgi:uncharacterized protein (TIGR03067 family)
MFRLPLAPLVLAVFLCALGGCGSVGKAPSTPTAEESEELKLLEGTWEGVSIRRPREEEEVVPEHKRARYTYRDGFFQVERDGRVISEGTFTIEDPSRRPRGIIKKYTLGNNNGATFYGIYEVKGDELLECYSEPFEPRPTELSPDVGNAVVLIRYRRLGPKS